MENFELYNPVKILFGKGQIAHIAHEIPKQYKILMTYGRGSIKKNGVYDQVMAALRGYDIVEFSGIEPNPHYETCMKAVDVIKKEKIDFILAVGGGSVLDGTKFIAAAVYFNGEPWDILEKSAEVEKAMPFASVMTLPATGSEMNNGAVITKASTKDKLNFGSPHTFPQFSVLDPTTTYSLPKKQIANGVVDAFVHTMEQYLTYPQNAMVQDRYAEALLMTLIEEGPKALIEPENYDVRANIMWAATCALNYFLSAGVKTDWATHMIGHELTAKYGLDHAQTLAIILPSMMKVMVNNKREKILQYADRVLNIKEGDGTTRIQKAIDQTREFFETMGIKTRLSDYEIDESGISEVIAKLEEHGRMALGERSDITLKISEKILRESL